MNGGGNWGQALQALISKGGGPLPELKARCAGLLSVRCYKFEFAALAERDRISIAPAQVTPAPSK